MRTFKLTINEDELGALINYHASHLNYVNGFSIERSSRIHDLTKRLHKNVDDAEVKTEPPVTETDQPKIEGWN